MCHKVYLKSMLLLFFFLDEKETKNQERTPTPIFFRAHSARTPEKVDDALPGSSLKMFTKHFLKAQPCTVRSRPRAFSIDILI
jgi:hypothetical protein